MCRLCSHKRKEQKKTCNHIWKHYITRERKKSHCGQRTTQKGDENMFPCYENVNQIKQYLFYSAEELFDCCLAYEPPDTHTDNVRHFGCVKYKVFSTEKG